MTKMLRDSPSNPLKSKPSDYIYML
jgi:hypothetical protein